jgi:hypothetical protein
VGYRVLGKTEDVFKGYGPRKGLEGPFVYANGRILYYSPKDGEYWDPTTDWFVSADEVTALKNQIFDTIKGS